MDEQALLHQISVENNLNIELLKDLVQDEKLLALIKAGKINNAILHLRKTQNIVGLTQAKMITDAFAQALKSGILG